MLCKFPCLIDGFHLIELFAFLRLLDSSGNDETVVRLSVFISISLTFQASLQRLLQRAHIGPTAVTKTPGLIPIYEFSIDFVSLKSPQVIVMSI